MNVRYAGRIARRFLSTSVSRGLEKKAPRVAVVGSGPAAFYSAQYLLKNVPEAKLDMFEKYPVPFGLVRFGVAPDHPEVKNVIHSFTQTARLPNFRFFGGVTVGTTISVQELLNFYHIVILAYGASKDRKLKISGEDGPGVLSAKDFVGWYNGLPDNVDLNPDLSVNTAIIIGQGNVAIDCARILLTKPEVLGKTDITDWAITALKKSQIQNVYVVGRRGPMQVAFTIKEFRELTKLANVNVIIPEDDVVEVRARLDQFSRPKKRLMELITVTAGIPPKSSAKNLYFKFLRSPKKILRTDNRSRVVGVNFKINQLENPDDPNSSVISTDEIEAIKCGLVIRSIGYEAIPIDPTLPYDANRHIIPNTSGRVETFKGLYCSGWIKRGPVGVILTTMNDAYETVDTILADLKNGHLDFEVTKPEAGEIVGLLRSRQCDPVSFGQWESLDAEEVARGLTNGKLREKIVDVREMISIAKGIPLQKLQS